MKISIKIEILYKNMNFGRKGDSLGPVKNEFDSLGPV